MEFLRRLRAGRRVERREGGLDLKRVDRILSLYTRGLLGRKVSVRGGWETLYLFACRRIAQNLGSSTLCTLAAWTFWPMVPHGVVDAKTGEVHL